MKRPAQVFGETETWLSAPRRFLTNLKGRPCPPAPALARHQFCATGEALRRLMRHKLQESADKFRAHGIPPKKLLKLLVASHRCMGTSQGPELPQMAMDQLPSKWFGAPVVWWLRGRKPHLRSTKTANPILDQIGNACP